MTLRAVIVDDSVEFLTSARRLLEREGITIVGVASTGAEALRRMEEHDPDVILVDVDLGDENGFDVAERIGATRGSRQPVVMISCYSEHDLVDLLAASWAIGFVSKQALSTRAIIDLLLG